MQKSKTGNNVIGKYLRAAGAKTRRYFAAYNFLGVVLGLVFVNLSFLPSLLPRGWILQGIMSAILFCLGYTLGTFTSHVVRKFNIAEPDSQSKRSVKWAVLATLGVSSLVFLWLGNSWQRQVRLLVGQDPDPEYSFIGMIVLGVLLVMFLLLLSRSIRSLFRWCRRQIARILSPAISYVASLVVTIVVVIGIVNGFILSSLTEAANEAFSLNNGSTESGISQPGASELSGSLASGIRWETLGRQGRTFIGKATSPSELSNFNQAAAVQPIRIYSGLESADDVQARARLAVDDLKRAGGFDRRIIVVATATGTGWIDEAGVTPVEYMYNGDSAIVSMQYSYLPSWLSFLVDQSKAKAAGNELYNAVYTEVLSMPSEQRPKLVVFGESLGSFGGESAFANQAAFQATSDGAVWAGPPNFNTLWHRAVEGRDHGSPEILPVYQSGLTIRFAARPDDFSRPPTAWNEPKVAYLQHASDPIVWWSPRLLLDEPDWLSEPRGSDVSPHLIWIPIITFWQITGDMVFSTAVPSGHGHKYGNLPTDAWSYVAPSEGWTDDKTRALKKQLADLE